MSASFSATLSKSTSASDGPKPHIYIVSCLRLVINSLFYPILGILLNLRNSLQGLGEKLIPLVSSVIELVGKILFVILFIPTLKYTGVIWCEPIIWCLMCIQLAWSFYRNSYIRNKENYVHFVENEAK